MASEYEARHTRTGIKVVATHCRSLNSGEQAGFVKLVRAFTNLLGQFEEGFEEADRYAFLELMSSILNEFPAILKRACWGTSFWNHGFGREAGRADRLKL